MRNGIGSDRDGIFINIWDTALMDKIKVAVFMGNEGDGIEVFEVTSPLYNTYRFGNGVHGDRDFNLNFH